MHAHQRPHRRINTDPLALQLIELAVSAGWKPRECIEFAREAHKFVTSTVSAVGAHQTVAPAKDIAIDLGQSGKSIPDAAPTLHRPEWGPDAETRRNALQALADQNRTMHEAAEILGISSSLVFLTASRLKVRFNGHRGRRLRPTASKDIEAPAKLKKRTAMSAPVNGKAVADPATRPRTRRPADPAIAYSSQRRSASPSAMTVRAAIARPQRNRD
jgi:hypothetical protein